MPVGPEPETSGSVPDSPAPAAGWYPDPLGPGSAWWTGLTWSDGNASRPAPAAESSSRPATASHASGTAAPQWSDDDLSGLANRPATIGIALGVAAVVVNPVLLIGLAAIAVSAAGLNRATQMGQQGFAAVGRGKASWGLALGLLATILSILFKGGLF